MSIKKSNFQKVQEFNRAFDMVPKEPANYPDGEFDEFDRPQPNAFMCIRPNLFIDAPKTIKLRLDLIDEEIKELNHAVETNDFVETRDALADILYVVYGMADVLGINIDCYFNQLFNNQVNILNSVNDITNDLHNKYVEELVSGAVDNVVQITNFKQIKSYCNVVKNNLSLQLLPIAQNLEEQKRIVLIRINENYKLLESYCLPSASTKDFETIANHINYILLWVYCYAYLSGVDADADFAIVHDSNMSKLCDTENDAMITVADYIKKYVAGTSPYDSPYYYELPELGKWIVKNKSSGKALKNIKYRKVDFSV